MNLGVLLVILMALVYTKDADVGDKSLVQDEESSEVLSNPHFIAVKIGSHDFAVASLPPREYDSAGNNAVSTTKISTVTVGAVALALNYLI
jgi:hypothetical protein